MKFLDDPPRFLFFTGKGGVGKTSVACATALHLVRQGKRVLLVSTDPASNVGQVLGVTIGNAVTPIEDVPALSGLEKQRTVYAQAVNALKDPALTRLVLVTRAQASSLAEVDRTYSELNQIGITGEHLVINGVLPPIAGTEDLTAAVRHREAEAIAAMPTAIAGLSRDVIELKASNMIGVQALDTLFSTAHASESPDGQPEMAEVTAASLAVLVDELERDDHGLVMCMGKGGVGKTTIAAAIAVALAHRGHEVHLTTTDPASHLTDTLNGAVPGLAVSRIDPVEATRSYREHVMATKGKTLDDAGRATLAEDLRSPCTEEVAVFQQFSRAVMESRRQFVVIDTAPTGHTLLLLDAAGSYHRQIARQMGDSMPFVTPLMRLQDAAQTKVILVTLAEPTPVTEAQGLQEDLERAGIHPWAWVINNSIAAAHPETVFLRHRAAAEIEQVKRVYSMAGRVAMVPLLATEPVGEDQLDALTHPVALPV